MDEQNVDKKFEDLSEDEFLGLDKYTYHVLKYIFSAHDICEIEWVYDRLLAKQNQIDNIIMEKFPSSERHDIKLEDRKILDGHRLKSLLNHNAVIVTKHFLDVSMADNAAIIGMKTIKEKNEKI